MTLMQNHKLMCTVKRPLLLPCFLFLASGNIVTPVIAAEYSIHGLVDLRASHTDSVNKSYLSAGQGKLGLNQGNDFFLAQGATQLAVNWDNNISAHAVVNAYLSDQDKAVGLTEGYLKYRSLPNQAGYRFQLKSGIFYPEISLENDAFAWASKNTLNSSFINTWIAEEVRVLGTEFKATRLGRINNNKFDLSASATAFINNDPTGALLAWHGWTSSSRQTLWTEKRAIPWFPALDEGKELENQARASDPFLELDNQLGYHLRVQWSLQSKGAVSIGYYDNQATPYKVVQGQYGWDTRFYHAGFEWKLSSSLLLTAQYLAGETLMQNIDREDVVNNSYMSQFIALTYRWKTLLGNNKHKSTLRAEQFSVTDHDQTEGDDNNEEGYALTLNHTYRLSQHWFLAAEATLIDSSRAARVYEEQAVDLVERQYQASARYFF